MNVLHRQYCPVVTEIFGMKASVFVVTKFFPTILLTMYNCFCEFFADKYGDRIHSLVSVYVPLKLTDIASLSESVGYDSNCVRCLLLRDYILGKTMATEALPLKFLTH